MQIFGPKMDQIKLLDPEMGPYNIKIRSRCLILIGPIYICSVSTLSQRPTVQDHPALLSHGSGQLYSGRSSFPQILRSSRACRRFRQWPCFPPWLRVASAPPLHLLHHRLAGQPGDGDGDGDDLDNQGVHIARRRSWTNRSHLWQTPFHSLWTQMVRQKM